MELQRNGKIHYLASSLLGDAPGLVHGFTTRHEGVSRHPYNSLNLGTSTNDHPQNVEGNRNILARAFGIGVEKLLTVRQIHGVDLLVLDAPTTDTGHFQKLECDGIVTNQRGVMLGVTVADCVPVLLHDPRQGVVAALHAGWQGTAGRICQKGVAAMQELFGCRPGDLRAAIGPAIGGCCYEVDEPVMQAFRAQGSGFDSFATPAGPGKWQLDLAAANLHQLRASGLDAGQIDLAGHCVSCMPDRYFSYRRDRGETGRQMGFIMLAP